jgi:hypothetical protein
MIVIPIITLIITVLVTASMAALVAGLCVSIKFVCPARGLVQRLRSQLQQTQIDLADERRTRADIVKWIEHECCAARAFTVERALKQRIDERLEVLRQLRRERQQLREH